MSDNIPTELLNNIFCQLPAESVLQCKGVCKSWRQIIDDPNFIKYHTKHQQHYFTNPRQLLVLKERGNGSTELFSLYLDSLLNFDDYSQQLSVEAIPVTNLIRPSLPLVTPLPVASCNGLFLVTHPNVNKKTWVLWNPLTQEAYELPEFPEYDGSDFHLHACGLAYYCVDDDFKVVKINTKNYNPNIVYKTLVYSLKYDSWKCIKNCPGYIYGQGDLWGSQGVYLNSALYWMSWNCIITLDLSTEDYRQLQLPYIHYECGTYSSMNLDVLGGQMVLSFYHRTTQRFNGWVMKDDGGNISWTNLFSCEGLNHISFIEDLRPITYLNSNKHVLLQHNEEGFFLLDTTNNSAKKILMHEPFGIFSCHVWQCSLFRLRNIRAKRTGRKKQMSAKKRLKLDMTIT